MRDHYGGTLLVSDPYQGSLVLSSSEIDVLRSSKQTKIPFLSFLLWSEEPFVRYCLGKGILMSLPG